MGSMIINSSMGHIHDPVAGRHFHVHFGGHTYAKVHNIGDIPVARQQGDISHDLVAFRHRKTYTVAMKRKQGTYHYQVESETYP